METTGTLPAFESSTAGTSEYNSWLFSIMQPYIRERVLLVGQNISAFSSLLINQSIRIHICEQSAIEEERLHEKYRGNELVRAIHHFDFNSPDFARDHTHLAKVFRTVILHDFSISDLYNANVLDHLRGLLRLQRRLILTMPALTKVYNDLQLTSEDWIRMDRKPLKQFLANYDILKTRYFSLNGVAHTQATDDFSTHVLVIARRVD